MSQPLFPSLASLGPAYQQHAVPAVYSGASASQLPPPSLLSDAQLHGLSPLSSSALMFGQEQSAYRSAMHMHVQPAQEYAPVPMHQLAQSHYVARAMHVAPAAGAYEPQHQWHAQQHFTQTIGADAWPAAPHAALKQLQATAGAGKPDGAVPPPSAAPELPALQLHTQLSALRCVHARPAVAGWQHSSE